MAPLQNILRSTVLTAATIGALAAAPKTAEAQTPQQGEVCTLNVPDYERAGFLRHLWAALPFTDNLSKENGTTSVQGRNLTPAQQGAACGALDDYLNLHAVVRKRNGTSEAIPFSVLNYKSNPTIRAGADVERIDVLALKRDKTGPAPGVAISSYNGNYALWDGSISRSELPRRTFQGVAQVDLKALTNRNCNSVCRVPIAFEITVDYQAPAQKAASRRTAQVEDTTRLAPAPSGTTAARDTTPSYGVDLRVPSTLTVPTDAFAKVEGNPLYVEFTTTDARGRHRLYTDRTAPFMMRLEPGRLPAGNLDIEAKAVYRNELRTDSETTTVVKPSGESDGGVFTGERPALKNNSYLSFGAGGVMDVSDIKNGVPRSRLFKQDLSGYQAEARAVLNTGGLRLRGSASYTRTEGEQRSENTNNLSELQRDSANYGIQTFLTTPMGLGLAAEAQLSSVGQIEHITRNEDGPGTTIETGRNTTTYGAGLGYVRGGLEASVMIARRTIPDGYRWDEKQDGFKVALNYDALLQDRKLSLETSFERFEGDLAPTGIQHYSRTINVGARWHPVGWASLNGGYTHRMGDGAEYMRGETFTVGASLTPNWGFLAKKTTR